MASITPPQPGHNVGRIDNKRPSLPEWYYAIALMKLGWQFRYQVPFGGGRTRAGGTVADFVVLTMPKADIVFVDGGYWHGSASQRERDLMLRNTLMSKTGGRYRKVVTVTGSEVVDVKTALATAKKHHGSGK